MVDFNYRNLITIENLFQAWNEFKIGKRKKPDVQEFERNLEDKLFDPTFIYDSYSCRLDKGTHKGVKRLEYFVRKVSKNYTGPCLTLKCDIKKFFASVDHEILLGLLKRKVREQDILWLLLQVIHSFSSEKHLHKGIPLGNLTSQVFANIYMNELDQFCINVLIY